MQFSLKARRNTGWEGINMNRTKQFLALVLAVAMVACLAGCGLKNRAPEEMAETTVKYIQAEQGGSVSLDGVEALDTSAHVSTAVQDGMMYVSIKNIQNGNTRYFRPAGDTITVTGYMNSDSGNTAVYKLSLWMLNDENKAQYVEGCTLQMTADGTCYTGTLTGLDPSRLYKFSLGYATAYYYLSGGITVSPVSNGELVDAETSVEG